MDKFAEQIAADKSMSREAMVLTRPDSVYRYDGLLALRAAARVMAGEPLPTPEQVAQTDLEWERDVHRAIQLIRFHEDYALRPAFMQ